MPNRRLTRWPILKTLASETFFKVIIGLLVLQALWIAFSGRYPMAFDENFHLGLIDLYSKHPSPFWSEHPSAGDPYGPLTRDPSYLYHLLMSFPYRFIGWLTDSFPAQVVWLRMLNIGLSAWGLWLYRQLLLRTGASRALVHFSLLIFVLVPVVPLLAAQINYDNLILPLTALSLLMTLKFSQRLTKQTMDLKLLAQLVILCVFASLVKYAFLPVFAAIVLFLSLRLYRGYKPTGTFKKVLRTSWSAMSRSSLLLLLAALLVGGILFAERYAVNLIRYQAPAPGCEQVLSYDNCRHYSVWIRDHEFAQNKPDRATDPVTYTQKWLHGMWFRSFFAVDGPASDYETRSPLTLPAVAGAVMAILSALAFAPTARRLWRKYDPRVLWLFSFVIMIHLLAVWLTDYRLFLETHRPVAINGRYLLPILPLILLIAALSLKEVTARRQKLQTGLAVLTLLCFLWGGGALTYVLRSNPAWYWPGSPLQGANQFIQSNIGPLVPGNDKPLQFFPKG